MNKFIALTEQEIAIINGGLYHKHNNDNDGFFMRILSFIIASFERTKELDSESIENCCV